MNLDETAQPFQEMQPYAEGHCRVEYAGLCPHGQPWLRITHEPTGRHAHWPAHQGRTILTDDNLHIAQAENATEAVREVQAWAERDFRPAQILNRD